MSRSAGTAARWPNDEVVVDPDVVAAGQKQLDRVAADVARAAGDENAHGGDYSNECYPSFAGTLRAEM